MSKFFLTDLDGTLLRNDTSMSEYTIKILKDGLANDLVISYSTARSYTSSKSVTSKIPWKYPMVLYNGAVLFDPMEGKVIKGYWLDNELVNTIIGIGKTYNLTPLIFCLDKENKECVLHERMEKKGYIEFYSSRKDDPRFREVKNLIITDEFRVVSITFIELEEEVKVLREHLYKEYKDKMYFHFMKDNYIEGHYFFEITNIKANKDEGLIEWCKIVGCSPKEVIVFGDNLNDLGLFAKAGIRIAVSNANPFLKEEADFIIPSNEEDGVAKYIDEMMRK